MEEGFMPIITAGAGGISARKVVYISAANTMLKAKADSATTLPPVGFSVGDVAAASSGRVKCKGMLGGFTGLTASSDYYLSGATAGAISTTKSRWKVGTALSTTEIWIHIEEQVILIVADDTERDAMNNPLEGQLIYRIDTDAVEKCTTGGATPVWNAVVGTYLTLTDVAESSYSGHAGKVPNVNAGETGLEFTTKAWDVLYSGNPAQASYWNIGCGSGYTLFRVIIGNLRTDSANNSENFYVRINDNSDAIYDDSRGGSQTEILIGEICATWEPGARSLLDFVVSGKSTNHRILSSKI